MVHNEKKDEYKVFNPFAGVIKHYSFLVVFFQITLQNVFSTPIILIFLLVTKLSSKLCLNRTELVLKALECKS